MRYRYCKTVNKESMKTVLEWLHTIKEDDIREKALNNANRCLDVQKPTLRIALVNAFIWDSTPEGADFWNNYCESLKTAS